MKLILLLTTSAALLGGGLSLAANDSAPPPASGPAPSWQRPLIETDGRIEFEAEAAFPISGGWCRTVDQGRTVMRMAAPDGQGWTGRHMYLAYRIRFTTPGRYRLWGLMRSTGTKATDDVWIYWNREPGGESREDFELKVETTEYAWSSQIKDLPEPEPPSKRPKNRDIADKGFPVAAPGIYTLYVAKGEEPFGPDHGPGTDSDFFAFDRFRLSRIGSASE